MTQGRLQVVTYLFFNKHLLVLFYSFSKEKTGINSYSDLKLLGLPKIKVLLKILISR